MLFSVAAAASTAVVDVEPDYPKMDQCFSCIFSSDHLVLLIMAAVLLSRAAIAESRGLMIDYSYVNNYTNHGVKDAARKSSDVDHQYRLAAEYMKTNGNNHTSASMSIKRELDDGSGYGGPRTKVQMNSIDECWRGDAAWAQDRAKLAECAIGFGSGTTGGGRGGRVYVVTDPGDDAQNPRPGTLRYGAIQLTPTWITFARDMTVTLHNELLITSDTTIDGRGAEVHIAHGPCLTIQYVSNVIIHGLHIHDCKPGTSGLVRSSTAHIGYRQGSDGDGISVFGSKNIWIDHNFLSSCADGLIDVIHASTAVTISNNVFTNHDKVMLLGHNDAYTADKTMQVTVAFNQFGPGLVQRMPRCRFGFFHVINNDYYEWSMYAVGGSAAPTIISEGNRYQAASAKEVTKRDCYGSWEGWTSKSIDDTFLDGAYFVESGPSIQKENRYGLGVSSTFVPYMTAGVGPLKCNEGVSC